MKFSIGTLSKFYGYGIVDKHGQPYMEEWCVSTDKEPIQELASNLSDKRYYCYSASLKDRTPFRVVKLVFEEL